MWKFYEFSTNLSWKHLAYLSVAPGGLKERRRWVGPNAHVSTDRLRECDCDTGNRLLSSHLSQRKFTLQPHLLYKWPKITLKWWIGALKYLLYKVILPYKRFLVYPKRFIHSVQKTQVIKRLFLFIDTHTKSVRSIIPSIASTNHHLLWCFKFCS